MLDRLIDLLVSVLHLFRFWVVINEYERGLVLRLGRPNRDLGPGWHPLWPFGIEAVLSDNVVPATNVLPPQSLTTRDGHAVVVSAIVTWRITNLRRLMLEVEGAESVVLDLVAGEIGRSVAARPWDSVRSPRFARDVKTRVSEFAEPYGIEIERLQIRDLQQCGSLRLFQGGNG